MMVQYQVYYAYHKPHDIIHLMQNAQAFRHSPH
jgi:hypothetical protein